MRRLLAAAGLAAALACAGPGGEAPVGKSGVALRFDWPAGLVAEVELVRSLRRSDPGGEVAATQRLAWRWRVEATEGGGRRIAAERVRLQEPETGATRPWDALSPERRRRLAALVPTLHVDAEGRLREARAPDGEPLGGEARERAAALWEALVARWSGRTLEPGATRSGEGERRLALFDGLALPVATATGAGQWLPCHEDAAQPRCLELEASARSGGGGPPASAPATLRRVALEEESYLVSEPQGLVPHYFERTRRLEIALAQDAGAPVALESLEQRVYRLRWE